MVPGLCAELTRCDGQMERRKGHEQRCEQSQVMGVLVLKPLNTKLVIVLPADTV